MGVGGGGRRSLFINTYQPGSLQTINTASSGVSIKTRPKKEELKKDSDDSRITIEG